MEQIQQTGLCPICGKRIHVIGTTVDGRLIGSCKDAFTYKQWQEEEQADHKIYSMSTKSCAIHERLEHMREQIYSMVVL